MKTVLQKLSIIFYSIVLVCLPGKIRSQAGSALNFAAGSYNYVEFSPVSSCWTLGNNFTLEMWINPTSTSNQILLYAGYGCIVCPQWVLGIGPEITCGYGGGNGKIVFSTIMGGRVESDVSPTAGVWVHVAITYNGSVMKMYVNGKQQSLVARIAGTVGAPSYMEMGVDPGCGFRLPYDGSMDELRIWNVERSQCQIQSYMNCEIPTTATNLTANFHFNAGTAGGSNFAATSLVDASGNSVTGNLYSFYLNGGSSNWVTPGGVTNGNIAPTVPSATINVKGNSTTIADGDITPSITDFTDFNGTLTRTFVIQNSAGGTMNLAAYLTGPAMNDFSITTLPSANIAGVGTTSIVVTLLTGGVKNATVNITNNDCSIPVYDFAITASSTKYQALNFDGVDDAILLDNRLFYDFTIEFWMRTTQTAGTGPQWYYGAGLVDGEIAGIVEDFGTSLVGNKAAFGVGNGDITIFSSSPVNTGQWVHVAATRQDANGAMNLYVNGVLEATGAGPGGGRIDATLAIGKILASGNYYHGDLDEIRLWNNVRTQCEIQTYMNCELVASSYSTLVGYYRCNQGAAAGNASVTTLVDASNVCNAGVFDNGTLSGFALTGPGSNWITPGAIATDYTTPSSTLAIITVKGNATTISNNDFTPTTGDFTDFQSNSTRTFVIQNTGTGILNINSVSFAGSSEFSLVSLSSNALNTSASSTLVIAFTPTAGGVRSATVSITTSNCGVALFNFGIQGNAPLASALNFDGSNDYVETSANITELGQNDFTIEAWIKTTGNDMGIVTCQNNNGIWEAGEKAFYIENGGDIHFNGHSNAFINTTYTVNDGNWHHVAVVWHVTSAPNGIGKIYVDGIDRTSACDYTANNNNLGTFKIGQPNFNECINYFNGNIDEVRIWNTARTQCQIQSYMNCEIPAISPGLLANYHFNQGSPGLNNSSVATLTDAAGTYTGALTNFSLAGLTSNWVNPGPFTSGYTVSAAPSASITLTGNSNPISNNSTTVTTLNFTDFGPTGAGTHTFVIKNSNTGTLNIGAPYLTGLNASEYSITVLPSSTLAASATTSFVIAFTPTASGVRVATVNINNNDCNIPIFNFAINGAAPVAAALNFDGVDDFIDLSSNGLPTGNNDFTVEFWVKIKSAQTFHRWIAWMGSVTSGSMVTFGYDGNNGNKIRVHHLGPDLIATTASIPQNVWTHVAINYKGATFSNDIFINGTYIETLNFGVPLTLPTNGTFQVGTFDSFSMYCPNIDLDEFRIWNRALCASEILNNMNCEIATTGSGLVANYHFNQGSVGVDNSNSFTLPDFSGSVNTGTLNGFALTGTTSNWVSPGAVTSGSSCSVYLNPEIDILGNAVSIPNISPTPTLSNFTDFGNVNLSTVLSRTFVIQNTGTGNLTIFGYSLTGLNASSFTITTNPASIIPSAGSTSIVVSFSAAVLGPNTATLLIGSNDCDESLYNFGIKAAGTIPGKALNFVKASTSAGNYATVPHNLSNNLGAAYTIEAWINFTGTDNAIVDKGNYDYLLEANPFNNGFLGFYTANTGAWSYSTGTLTPGVWTHVAVTLSAGTLTFYINGAASGTAAVAFSQDSGPLNIGRQQPSTCACNSFNGSMDELRIWNLARSCSEIAGNMNNELLGTESGLVAYYNFNQGFAQGDNSAITTVTDLTGNNNATLTGGFILNGLTSNWVAPGSPATGTVATPQTEINVVGNFVNIIKGSSTPILGDFTHFGNVCTNTIMVRTYSIQNTGTAPLSVSSVTMSGLDAALFTVSALSPASPVASGSFAVFSVTLTPSSTGIKIAKVNITNNDCDEGLYDFAVSGICNALPVVSASTSNSVICNTFTTSVSGSGADTYTWTGTIPATNVLAFTPTATANYTVTGTNTLSGCTSTNLAVQTITVSALPIITLTAVSNSVCFGGSATITAAGANTYTWNPGSLNGATINPVPALTTTYSAFGSNTLTGCTSTNVVAQTITVNAIPTVTAATPNATICAGIQTTLTASGAGTYTWSPGPVIGTTVNPVPGGTVIYSLAGTSTAGCNSTNSATVLITVNPLPTVGINPLIVTICAGGTASLSATGANTYTWNPGVLTTTTITPSPTNSTIYTLIGKSLAGCSSTNTATQNVTVNALPTVTAGTTNSVICNSGTTSLIGSGADTYTWNPTIANASPFSPIATANYTLSGTYTLTGCSSTNIAVQTISVNPSPTLGLSVINPTICAGKTTTITASGAGTYTWLPGPLTLTVITPTLTSTTIYTLTGSSPAGCQSSNTLTQTITVNTLPLVTASASNPSVCAGFSTTLNGGGAVSYTWTGSVLNNTAFLPGTTNSYTVTGTDINTCENTASITITVNPIPSVTANITSTAICQGSSLTLSGSGAVTYTWSGNISDGTAFAPAASGNYSLTGFSGAGCTSTNAAVVSVTVNTLPTLTASASNSAVCLGNTATLSGAGALTYTWTGGVTNNTSFTPTLSSTYTLTGEDVNSCQNTANVGITVNSLPVLIVSGTKTLSCEAETTTLTATGATAFTWNSGQTSSSIVISPTLTTSYSVTGTNANGCINTATYIQSVSPCNGSITAVVSVTNVSCQGKKDGKVSIASTNTYSNGEVSYIWSPNILCTPNTCDHLEGLNGGTISLTIKVTYTLNNILVKQDSLVISPVEILDENGPCELKIFNGVTPNGDGLNDTWQIDNITEFPKNKVTVFNRWGQKVYEVEGYDNAAKSWPTGDEASKLQPNTYFYIIDLGNGGKLIKGWVELIKN